MHLRYKAVKDMTKDEKDAILTDLMNALEVGMVRVQGMPPMWESLDNVMMPPTEMKIRMGQPKRGQLFIDNDGQIRRAKRDHTRDGVQKPVLVTEDETSY